MLTKIKDFDKDRTLVVEQLCQAAKAQSAQLMGFKTTAMQEVNDFIARSLAQYEVAAGGKKGNVTLISFDGKHKIVRQMEETITFDERLQAAKALIHECIQGWGKGSNHNIKALVNHAFQVDQQGKISTGRVLSLRGIGIKDDKWLRAMPGRLQQGHDALLSTGPVHRALLAHRQGRPGPHAQVAALRAHDAQRDRADRVQVRGHQP